MPAPKTSPKQTESWEHLLRLQERLVRRTSSYLQNVGDLVGQGSLEPREYIEQSAKMWAAVVGDVGEWLKPPSDLQLDDSQVAVSYVTEEVPRAGSHAVNVEIPAHVFPLHRQDVVVRLTTDGLIRKLDAKGLGRPALVLEWERHLRFSFAEVESGSGTDGTRNALEREGLDVRSDQRKDVVLRVYDLPDTINANEVYEGIVWGDVMTLDDQKRKRTPQRVPVAVVALTIK